MTRDVSLKAQLGRPLVDNRSYLRGLKCKRPVLSPWRADAGSLPLSVFLQGERLLVRVMCSPAVDHSRSGTGTSVDVVPDGADELDEGLRGLWDSVVGPHGVVEVAQDSGVTASALLSQCSHVQ